MKSTASDALDKKLVTPRPNAPEKPYLYAGKQANSY